MIITNSLTGHVGYLGGLRYGMYTESVQEWLYLRAGCALACVCDACGREQPEMHQSLTGCSLEKISTKPAPHSHLPGSPSHLCHTGAVTQGMMPDLSGHCPDV